MKALICNLFHWRYHFKTVCMNHLYKIESVTKHCPKCGRCVTTKVQYVEYNK